MQCAADFESIMPIVAERSGGVEGVAARGRDQRVVVSNVVSNVVGGVVHGRFLVVPSTVSSRHPVVFASSSDPFVVAESRTYRGYCFGVTFDPIPGIPVDPPFVYVLGVSPAP